MPAPSEPLAEIFKLTVLGDSPATISRKLSDMGYTLDPKRVETVQKRWGAEIVQWVREEYMDDIAVAIFDYRKEIQSKMHLLDKRFKEADSSYEDWKQIKGQTFAGLLEEYRNDASPDITRYLARANAMTEGMNLQKLSKVLKDLHAEEVKLLDLAAKIDAKFQTAAVTTNTTININEVAAEIYEHLCDECRGKLAESLV